MPLSTLHPPRLFLLPVLRPNSHLNWLSISCWRRLASVSGRSEGCSRRLACGLSSLFLLLSDDRELRFFSFLSPLPPWLERQLRVLERKLPPLCRLLLGAVGEVGDELMGPPAGTRGRAVVVIGMVEEEVGVDVPEEAAYGIGGRSLMSELEDDEEWPDDRDLRDETRRWKRSLIDILGDSGWRWLAGV